MPFDPYYSSPKGWMPESAGLTVNQLASIGFVMSTWEALESIFQNVLFVLAQSPDSLGQALTEDLSADNRSKALKRLCSSWKLVLGDGYEKQIAALDGLDNVRKWIDANKGKRNQIAHWNWLRVDDKNMFAFKMHLKPTTLADNAPTGIHTTHDDLFAFGGEIGSMASELIGLLSVLDQLPPWPQKQR